MNIKYTLVGLMILPLLVAKSVNAIEVNQATIDAVKNTKIDIVKLPITGMNAMDSNGQIMFVSDNGRFVITGQIIDIWQKKTLDTMSEMAEVSGKIPMGGFNLDLDALNTVTIGNGDKEVIVFIDPQSEHCHTLIKQAMDLGSTYTFKLIVVPAMGEESNRLSKKLFCSVNRKSNIKAILDNSIDELEVHSDCDTKQYDKTLVLAQVIGIKGVPYLIAPDGRFFQGLPKNLNNWLEEKQ